MESLGKKPSYPQKNNRSALNSLKDRSSAQTDIRFSSYHRFSILRGKHFVKNLFNLHSQIYPQLRRSVFSSYFWYNWFQINLILPDDAVRLYQIYLKPIVSEPGWKYTSFVGTFDYNVDWKIDKYDFLLSVLHFECPFEMNFLCVQVRSIHFLWYPTKLFNRP